MIIFKRKENYVKEKKKKQEEETKETNNNKKTHTKQNTVVFITIFLVFPTKVLDLLGGHWYFTDLDIRLHPPFQFLSGVLTREFGSKS